MLGTSVCRFCSFGRTTGVGADMGWFCVFAMDSFVSALSPASLGWLIAGGIFYTTGIVFFILDNWYPWCHGVWHLFVIAGSASHYFSILLL